MSVILSLGRHEEYGSGLSLPISAVGATRAWLSACLIEQHCGRPDYIFASPIARAAATAKIRAAAWRNLPLELQEDLAEDASPIVAEACRLELIARARQMDWKHIHLISHAPTISRLNGGIPAPLNVGDLLIWQAESWDAMEQPLPYNSLLRVYSCESLPQYAEILDRWRQQHISSIDQFIEMMVAAC